MGRRIFIIECDHAILSHTDTFRLNIKRHSPNNIACEDL